VSGLVDETVLSELDIFLDRDMMSKLKAYNKKSMRLRKISDDNYERFIVSVPNESETINRKLDYLNQRLGLQLTIQEAVDYKIILSFSDFIVRNELTPGKDKILEGVTPEMLYLLNKDYIGFLSCNNNRIIFRDITGNNKYRYYKVIINERNLNSASFFSLPSKISLIYTNNVNIHIAEGPFDILSIKENVVKEKENNFYYAICGFGGTVILKHLIHTGVNTGLRLHIYADADKSDWLQRNIWLKKQPHLQEWVDHFYIHRNQYNDEKDYGVPLSNIIDVKSKLK